MDSNNSVNNINKDKENHYRDFLPENRVKNESISPKLFGIISAVVVIAIIVFIGYMHFSGKDILKNDSRYYNLNMSETLDLDSVYKSGTEEVTWESNSNNVEIKNNVVTAVTPGKAYILARVGNKQVSDVNITILNENTKLAIDNHSINIKKNERRKVNTITNVRGQNRRNVVSNKDNDVDKDIDDGDDDYNDYETDAIIIQDTVVESDDNTNLTYESSNEKVAIVDDDGNIIPKEAGIAVITVKDDEGNEDHTYVTVVPDDIIIPNDSYNIKLDDTIKIDYVLESDKYNNDDIIWSSNNPNVVSVDNDGNVSARNIGEGVIELSVGEIKKEVNVKVDDDIILPIDLTVDKTDVFLMVGYDTTVEANVLPVEASNKDVIYNSNNTNVAMVDSNGKIIGKGVGKTIITVTTSNGIKKEINVTVNKKIVSVSGIDTNNKEITFNVGDSSKLEYTISPSNASNKSVKIDYDKNYLEIDKDNNIIAKKSGVTELKLTTIDQNKSVTIKVNINGKANDNKNEEPKQEEPKNEEPKNEEPNQVTPKEEPKQEDKKPLVGISLNKSSLNLVKGNRDTLVVSYNPSDTTDSKSVIWSSSNKSVATVSNGVVTAVGSGSAVIKATVGGKSAECRITVTVPLTSISLNKSSLNLVKGNKDTLVVSYNPSDTTDSKNVIWSSSNNNVATVSNGVVTAIGSGSAVIKATVGGKSATCKINVTEIYTIKLDGQGANVQGTNVIYEEYNKKWWLSKNRNDSDWLNTDSNGIKIPQKNGYTFAGYFTEKNGKGTQIITKDGFIVAKKYTTFRKDGVLYAWWKENIDVVLMWGQSNMVGTAVKSGYQGRGVKDPRTLNKEYYNSPDNKYDDDIISNYKTIDLVDYSIDKNKAWEYRYRNDMLVELNNSSLKSGSFGEYIKDSNDISVLARSKGTNMIPYFAKAYVGETGHKLVIVHAAYGGKKISCFLPHTDSDYNCDKDGYYYEVLKAKYLKAVKKIEKNYSIANSFYIVMQGEADVSSGGDTNKYYNTFMKVHKNLKKYLKLDFGAIIYTAHTIDTHKSASCILVDNIHKAQSLLIKNNGDIMLASDWGYKMYTLNYYNAFGPQVKTKVGDKVIDVNKIHFTSASLSKIGVDSAMNIAKKINNPSMKTNNTGLTKNCK